MNRSHFWIVLFLFLIPAASLADRVSQQKKSGSVVGDLGNGGLPVPFSEFNRKVELAVGENYALSGWIRFSRDGKTAFFHIDFTETPWLANANRQMFPYYPLVGWDPKWNSLREKRVRIFAKSVAEIVKLNQDGEEYYYYSIKLDPYNQPIELKDQRRYP